MSKSRDDRSQETANVAEASTSGESDQAQQLNDSQIDETPERDEAAAAEAVSDSVPATETGNVEELEAKIAELNDQILRKQADFENFRKRMFREREEATRSGNSKLLLDLVEIIDNFERAIKSSEESRDFDSFREGIELIEKQFVSMLESKWGLTRFESEGEEFDPEKHEAIAVDQSGEHPAQTVVDDYQKGYMLHDRVLRHAKVRVAMPTAEDSPSADAGGTDEQAE